MSLLTLPSTLERKYGNVCGERDGSSSRSEDERHASL